MDFLQVMYSYLSLLFDVRTALIALIVFLILSWIVHRYLHRVKNLPPGPRSWPIIGCLPQLFVMNRKYKNNIYELLQALSEQYGPVFCLPLPFGFKIVFVYGYKTINEVLTSPDLGEEGLPYPEFPDELTSGKGVLASSGEHWREHRIFSLTVLRGLGVGKRSFADQISTESTHLLEEIESKQGQPFEATVLISNAVSNIICSVVLGKRFEYNDPEFENLLHALDGMLDQESFVNVLFIFFPKLAANLFRIPYFRQGSYELWIGLRRKIQDIVDEHRETLDTEEMRDFIDVYLGETQKKHEQGMHTYLGDSSLRAIVQDLFLAGTETTSTTLRWALLFMLKFPEVQERVQTEIDTVVGRDRLPRFSDKPNLPYTQAVIHEIQRYGSIVFLMARYAKGNTKFLEFTIPKGTTVNSNLRSATRDPSVWEEPDAFKPERFLDDKGQVVIPSQQMVFGAGKRKCVGEQLARMELFIFYTHLMHRFSFKKATEADILTLQPKPGIILTPHPYNICAVVR